MKNIVLFGFMGTGKTSVAKLLSRKLNREYIEMDDLIEQREGVSINEIFRNRGEEYFRICERELVRKLAGKGGRVISTGGGVVLDPDNISAFRKNGILICLSASPEVIYNRVRHETHRPLLNTPDPLRKIGELLEVRTPYYAGVDHQVATDGKNIEQIAEEIITLVQDLPA